ncbi:hypothetical protein NHX12_023760 [Muraenolepis orangiensis]|uniref:BHLH domain-containing protein n=1 Tax=Muraenolepis orangiensis TaxID=630683 RepID=A0A9Q0IU44_9TELE|nr:hypothetical protein NHX12_023760 [Muraenolepis orangiensis]
METEGRRLEPTLSQGFVNDPVEIPPQQVDDPAPSCPSYQLRLYGEEDEEEEEDDAWDEEEESGPGGAARLPGRPRVSYSARSTRRRVISAGQRQAANGRERRRMLGLNDAFDALRRKVPAFAYEKRLSRVDTLRLAVVYISFMTELLGSRAHRDGDRTPHG